MQNGIILEIAVRNIDVPPRRDFHWWRIRWIENGQEVDRDHSVDTLNGMASDARMFARTGETVAWRYYETGL